ncbi:MAG: metal ABC transporter substrate-binding protein, partial [Synergistaceae bacterium]|nr:metal ABC transporter substrate-binding protein [Synergistaceae bacterium]
MKKFLMTAALFAALLCAFVSGADAAEKLKIITTIFPQYDFARQITGGEADVTMLLRPGSESHSFEPTPQDIIKIGGCDMF